MEKDSNPTACFRWLVPMVLIYWYLQSFRAREYVHLLYNDEYRKHCLDHAGMYRVLYDAQMIYNTQFTILYILIEILNGVGFYGHYIFYRL